MGKKVDKDFIVIRPVTQNKQERQVNIKMEENKVRIKAFLSRHIIKPHDLKDDVDIFAAGFVNSLFAMQLVLFVEGEFAITLGNEDLKLDNFRSINALADLIERKTTSTIQA